MAYTKIHAIKATVDKAIDYICNPDKTDEKIFISSFACSPETAAIDFKYTLDLTIAEKTVPIKPIISYRLLLRAKSVLKKLTKSDRNLQTDYYMGNIPM